jgi:cellulose synthase (UDP-forming)
MDTVTTDPRLASPTWDAGPPSATAWWRARLVAVAATVGLIVYFVWLLRPGRIGNPLLYALLVVVGLFNALQAVGFWWTCLGGRRAGRRGSSRPVDTSRVTVDVFIPTYDEPVDVVEATIVAATRLSGAVVSVALLDDGNRDEMAALARRHGVRYVRRTIHSGAKAGNINHALTKTSGALVLVLDCDHVADPALLERTLPEFVDPRVAYVQTPQYYANAADGSIARASWSQQALFFGPIARGKAAHDAMFCCGTNVVFRRKALEAVGGFPEGSVTEDFELSVGLHEQGWSSRYVAEVLASGLGPEDLASYVSQQLRWARGCLGALGRVARSTLPWRLRLQYLLSASYFLTGWTVLVYVSLPVIRLTTGAQPVAGASADSFLAVFAPYFALSLASVAVVAGGTYTYGAHALATATFWIHLQATFAVVTGRLGHFVVTPKQGERGRQLRPAAPTLAVVAVLVAVAAAALARDTGAATLNNVGFAFVHAVILGSGVAPALFPALNTSLAPARPEVEELVA